MLTRLAKISLGWRMRSMELKNHEDYLRWIYQGRTKMCVSCRGFVIVNYDNVKNNFCPRCNDKLD
jgi:hypothetical protein